MAAFTVIESSELDNSVTAVWSYTVPGGNNAAGVAWSDVVAEIRTFNGEAGTSLNPRASAAHIAALDAGTILEQTTTADGFSAKANNTTKLNQLKAAINADEAAYVTAFANRYKFYGREDVS